MQMGRSRSTLATSKWCCSRAEAGVDVLAIANQLQYDPDNAAKTLALVKQLLHGSKLTPARIDESDVRIVKLKERLGKIQEGRMVALVSERNRPYARST